VLLGRVAIASGQQELREFEVRLVVIGVEAQGEFEVTATDATKSASGQAQEARPTGV
jgi:hypothetical protein